VSTSKDRDSEPLRPINWREALAWPVSHADRLVLEQLHKKEAAGADLTPQEHAKAAAIIQAAQRDVRNESSVKRKATADERSAELDKTVGTLLYTKLGIKRPRT
jgi:hypothetical protein